MIPEFEFCRKEFEKYGISLNNEVYEQLDVYAEFLVEYNKNVNLTAITEPIEVLHKHFIDSILVKKYVDLPQNSSLIDVGTGAGFPSVPLKIVRPDLKITLLDSLNKRVNFLDQLCERLGIEAEFVHGRAENFGKNLEYREKFDFSCARAVANLSVLSEYCIPFVKVGGGFISLKGPNEDVSIGKNAVKLLGGEIEAQHEYTVYDEQRRLILVRKISQTPTKYPRNSGQIKKKIL